MDASHYSTEEQKKYGRLFRKLSPVNLDFATKQKIRQWFNADHNLNNLPRTFLYNICFAIGKQVLAEQLSLPELLVLVKYTLKQWAEIESFGSGEITRYTPRPVYKCSFRKPKRSSQHFNKGKFVEYQ